MYRRFSDAELAEQMRDSDSAGAFGELQRRWRDQLAAYFRPLLADDAAADDAVQEVLCRLWTRRAAYRATGRFEAYLLALAKHHWLNERRRTARRETVVLDDDAVPGTDDPAHLSEVRETARQAVAALRRLPAEQQLVWRLICEDGLTTRQAAEQLGVPTGTVKSRLHAARQRILSEIGDGH